MNDSKQDASSLEKMKVKELLVNMRLNLEKTRGEARSALSQIREKSHEVNHLIMAIDGINTKWQDRIGDIESQIANLRIGLEELYKPWYVKLWNKLNGRSSKKPTA